MILNVKGNKIDITLKEIDSPKGKFRLSGISQTDYFWVYAFKYIETNKFFNLAFCKKTGKYYENNKNL